jgi:hypothetical protein
LPWWSPWQASVRSRPSRLLAAVAMEDSAVVMLEAAVAMYSPHPRVGSVAGAPLAEAVWSTEAAHSTEVVRITAAAAIMAAEDITAPVSDSAAASTRLMDTPLPFAIPLDSMMPTACGNTIPVAPCRTDIRYTRSR